MKSVLQQTCRLCACENPYASVNMFSEIGKKHQLPDKIRLCLPISVDEDDELPKNICVSCLYKLDVCNELYNTAFMSQNILKIKLDNVMSEESHISNGERKKNNERTKDKDFGELPSATIVPCKPLMKQNEDINLMNTEHKNTSPVIPQDVNVRLTSTLSHNDSPVMDFSNYEEPIDIDIEVPGAIIVTDITGAPLTPLIEKSDAHLSADCNDTLSSDCVVPKIEDPFSMERNNRLGSEINSGDERTKNHSVQHLLKEGEPNRNLKPITKKMDGKSKELVKCKFCFKYFSKKIINHHKRLHLKEKVFSCVDCGKNFSTETSLSLHTCDT